MKLDKLSLKVFTITLLGVIGVAVIILSIVVGRVYNKAALNEETRVLSRILGVAVEQVMNQLDEQVTDLVLSTQKADTFREAFVKAAEKAGDSELVTLLNDQFAQRFVTSGVLNLHKLRVYDPELNLLAQSVQGVTTLPAKLDDTIYNKLKARTGAERVKPYAQLWTAADGQVNFSVVTAIGGLRVIGYIEAVVDPAHNLPKVANITKTPLRISQGAKELFRSKEWSEGGNTHNHIVGFDLKSADGKGKIHMDVIESIEEFNSTFRRTEITSLVFFLAVIGGGVAFAITIFNSYVFSPLRNLTTNMRRCSEGDLTVKVEAKGLAELHTLGVGLAALVTSLREQVSEIHSHSAQLASAAEELSIITNESSDGLRKQTENTEQVATAINEMTATILEVSQNVEIAAKAAHNADNETASGKKIVTETIERIDALSQEIDKAAEVVRKLQSDSESIGTVMDVIRGIAEQTNLLALNAAIEAARAGEQGRGFAVVADEVRVLASRTQQSTQEIRDMIERLQSGATEAVKAMVESKSRAQSTVDQAAKAGMSLQTITEGVTNISDMSAQIDRAIQAHTQVADDINRNIINIRSVADQSSRGAEETTKASETLAQLAVQMQTAVGRFKV
ncbi:MAG: methyl-accepting chemotaxis protein [Gammaproteobacteria bacterium]|nr:methyl-accepting chemotaxis protein [Gammaproteobacteria bacterium]